MSHVALYCRVSTDEQATQGTIDTQKDFLREYARLYNLEAYETYSDDGVSGTVPLDKRPGGMRLLTDAEHKRFSQVVVYRVDRLARSLSALLAAYDALEALHVTIKSATEPFETSTPIGKFLFSLLGSLAELEKSTIIERLTLGRDRNVRNGRWFVNTVPLGYDVEDGVLVPSQRIVPALGMTEIAMVHELFQHIADGSSAVEECRRLQALGVAPSKRYSKRGEVTEARRWHISKIVSILHNPVYIGQHTFASKHGTITRDVPAIIDKALWERAQQTLANNRKLPKHQRHRSYLLRGLIKCGLCGLTFVGQPVNRPRNRVKKLDFYYRCSGRSGSVYPDAKDRCCNRHVRAEQLEELIWSDCLEFIHNPGAALHIAKQQLQGRQARTANVEQEKQRLQQALAAKTEEREMMLGLFRRRKITVEALEKQLEDIAQEETTLQGLLQGIKSQEDITDALADHYTQAEVLLTSFQGQITDTVSFEKKRQVIEFLVAQITIDELTHVEYVFSNGRLSSQHEMPPAI